MVDAVASVAKIVGVALKIKEAATTARQNKKDCHHIKSRVDVLNKTLSHHEDNGDLMEDPAVMAALEALHGILAEALEVITECQEKRNIICVYCAAANLSRQLSKVEQRITYLSSDAMLTIMSYQLLTKRRVQDSHLACHSSVVDSMLKENQDEANKKDQTQTSQISKENQDETNKEDQTQASPMSKQNHYEAHKKDQTQASRPLPSFGDWDVTELASKITGYQACSSSAAFPRFKMVCQPRSLVNTIAEVARNIKEAAETVLQNSDDCVEIAKRVKKVSILLPQLEDTKMADEPAMQDALEKLLVTFRRAHTLVIACQRRGVGIVWLSTLPGRLSKQLHDVLDQIASNIADMTAIALA